jgi:HlyD family secretion protein
VNVEMDFVNPAEVWKRLGDGYRVTVRIVTWESDRALRVPTSALFRQGDAWAVYAVEAGRARRVLADIGHRTAQEAEVTKGLTEGAAVIVHPADTLQDGARVEPRAGT